MAASAVASILAELLWDPVNANKLALNDLGSTISLPAFPLTLDLEARAKAAEVEEVLTSLLEDEEYFMEVILRSSLMEDISALASWVSTVVLGAVLGLCLHL